MLLFFGLDVHEKYTEVAIIDEDGIVEKQERVANESRQIEEFSNKLSNARANPQQTQLLENWIIFAPNPIWDITAIQTQCKKGFERQSETIYFRFRNYSYIC
jgi:hypothetical protein